MIIKDLFKNKLQKKNNTYIIAEAGVNHNGNLDLAKKLIDLAKQGEANAIKFQTYKAETLASRNSNSYWDTNEEKTNSQFQLFKKYDKFWKKEFELLKKTCEKFDIEFLSTPFDFESAKFLDPLMSAFKISSSDINNRPFIEYVTSFGKPIILSTGASFKKDIDNALIWSKKINKKSKIALLHCVLNYPTKPIFANISRIKTLIKLYPNNIIGYSDHTKVEDIDSCKLASAFGAKIIEKHFTHNKKLKGNDHYHAGDFKDFFKLRRDLDKIDQMLGNGNIDIGKNELKSMKYARRSIYVKNTLDKGSVINKNNIEFKRPGLGLPPSKVKLVLGKKLNKKIYSDNLLLLKDLKK